LIKLAITIKSVLFFLVLIFTSTKLFASTPAQVQVLIDNQQCEQALQVLVQEQQANTNKSSTIFDVLFIKAALCAGKVVPDNANDVLAKLKRIEKADPLLIGINRDDFVQLKAQLTAINNQQSDESMGVFETLIKLVVALLLIAGSAWLISFVLDRRRSGNLGESSSIPFSSDFSNRKNSLFDKASQLRATIDNQAEKARLREDVLTNSKLMRYLTSVDALLASLNSENSLTEVDFKAMETKLNNWAVLVKTI
jgi:hypothetical protein